MSGRKPKRDESADEQDTLDTRYAERRDVQGDRVWCNVSGSYMLS